MMFKKVESHPNFPKIEEEILRFWEKEKIFAKSLEKNAGKEKFIFYEGPPTANGRPGIHHVLARAYKDIICRYKTMRGYYIKRRAGWDTHGLPVEIEVEKKLGLKNKSEIEKYGIAKFNAECRQSVWKYKAEWEELTRRIGFWLDLKNPYITYENSYIEKVWGVLKKIWDKNLIYSGFKVVPYCPRCGTTLSSHEVAQGYQNIEEDSIYVKFAIKGEKKYFLVWTTTPWTLPGNIALAVNPALTYIEAESEGEIYILAKAKIGLLASPKIIRELKGEELAGVEYEPLYGAGDIFKPNSDKDYRVYSAEFVAAEEGTGLVHIAPAFGEDDLELKEKVGLSLPMTLSADGRVISEIANNQYFEKANSEIRADLEKRGLLYKTEKIRHDYPFCWRCESKLIYFAKSTWFINMSAAREKLLANNETVNWLPAHLKAGRFGNFLSEAKDWALSRERFWGTPLPIWVCQNNCDIKIIGSIEELKQLSAKPIDIEKLDLHKPYIDDIILKCESCGGEMRRVSEVIDVWFDSGAMPYASEEYPENFPADYIAEAIDQTRGWFYTMLAISTLLDDGPPYKNVISLAHVLDDKGKKMSKSRGNIIEPNEVIDEFGADALRWYFFTVNGPGEPKKMNRRSVELALRQFIIIFWNIYSFFTTYANIDGWDRRLTESKDILDIWALSRLNQLKQDISKNLDDFEVTAGARLISDFVSDFSTWYLRRSRKRRDKFFYSTCYLILHDLAILCAPFVPITAESLFQNLRLPRDPESVHLCPWPEAGEINQENLLQMDKVRKIAEKTHALRAAAGIRLRQPLSRLTITDDFNPDFQRILSDEVNVLAIVRGPHFALDTIITPELEMLGAGRDIIRAIQGLRKKAGLDASEKVALCYYGGDDLEKVISKMAQEIEKNTRVELIRGKKSARAEGEFEIAGQKIWLGISK